MASGLDLSAPCSVLEVAEQKNNERHTRQKTRQNDGRKKEKKKKQKDACALLGCQDILFHSFPTLVHPHPFITLVAIAAEGGAREEGRKGGRGV